MPKPSEATPFMLRKSTYLLLGLTVVVSGLTARLGFWQLDRAAQKTALQQAQQAQRALPALGAGELPRQPEQAKALLHRAVQLQGTWLAQHTVFLENRPMDGQVGFFVVTPLRLADASAVLVQRGWIPRDLLDRTRIALPAAAQANSSDVVPVKGRLALEPSRLFEFDPSAKGPIRQNLGVAAYAQETGLSLRPFTLVQEDLPGGQPDGLKRLWPAPTLGVDKHYGYAVQWFALSAMCAGLFVWFQVFRPRLQRAAKGSRP